MVTSTSVPASSPVASSGMMTYPSAAVSTDSSADGPNTGVATPCATRTWTTSRRPAADGRSRASRARTAGSGGGAVHLAQKDGKFSAEEAYFSPKNPTAIGGVITVRELMKSSTLES